MYWFKYNNETYTHNPEFEMLLGTNEDGSFILGDRLRDYLGMTDEESAACHAEGLLNELRHERDELIKQTDWVAGTDVPQSIKDKWNPYRQALRDITNSYSSLEDVVWPDKPE